MDVTNGDPRDVIAAVSDPERRSLLDELNTILASRLPSRRADLWTGLMWGGTEQTIIGYGRIVQPRPSGPGVRWFLGGVAAQRRTVSVYVNAVRDGTYLLRAYEARLGRLKVGSASPSIRSSSDLDRDVSCGDVRGGRSTDSGGSVVALDGAAAVRAALTVPGRRRRWIRP